MLARAANERGFDLVQVEEIAPDHGMALATLLTDRTRTLPIVPLFINSCMPLLPSPARCYALGGLIKDMVEAERPATERVVVVAGGASPIGCLPPATAGSPKHSIGISWTVWFKADPLNWHGCLVRSSNGRRATAVWSSQLGYAWPGALPGAHGEVLYYEPIPALDSGMGGLALRAT